jgi:hypothetical protein
MGRPLAERLGYPAEVLDQIPVGAIESFAGVGYFFISPTSRRARPWSIWAAAPAWTSLSPPAGSVRPDG